MQFQDWLVQQMSGISQEELLSRAKAAGYPLSQAQLSRILSGERQAGPEACISIAHALRLPREEVFRARGWLLPVRSGQLKHELAETLELLSDTDQHTLLRIARALAAQSPPPQGNRTMNTG